MESSKTSNKNPDTFLTQFPRLKKNTEIETNPPNSDTINTLYSELNNCVMSLDSKLKGVLGKHESDFLLQYKEKMYQIQKEIRTLEEKVNQKQNQKRKAQKLQSLELERDSLRDKAEQLDKACNSLKQRTEKWKAKAEEMEEDKQFLEEQILLAKRQKDNLKDQLHTLQSPQQSLFEHQSPKHQRLSTEFPPAPDYFQQLKKRFQETVSHLERQLDAEKKSLKGLRNAKTNIVLEKGELEDTFLECVEEVKKDIVARKAKSRDSKTPKRTNKEAKLEEFRDIDRRKVMELFLSKVKVKEFLYNSMFQQKNQLQSSKSMNLSQKSRNLTQLSPLQVPEHQVPSIDASPIK